MKTVLRECNDCGVVYIDDVLVYSNNWADHIQHLRRVFSALKEHGLTCKPTKCQFGMTRLKYLGHVIGSGSVSVPEHRMSDMKEFVRPVTRKQLRSFLGAISYYCRFIEGFHRWSSILSPHTSSSAPRLVRWTELMDDAFTQLKLSLCSYCVLCIPTDDDSFRLETDALSSGVGAVLMVKREDQWRPVAYYSK